MDGRQEEINTSPCQRFAILGDICKIDGLFVSLPPPSLFYNRTWDTDSDKMLILRR